MTSLYWHTLGDGVRDLVLLHGWGLNAEVWSCIVPRLTPHFRLHCVDLPGYGRSQGYGGMDLAEMASLVADRAPPQAFWLGWSLGGLVASQVALEQPERVRALINVASSPCFSADPPWPGIRPEVLSGFEQQLREDFHRTVERFLALQTLGTESARQDARRLKQMVLDLPLPPVEVLTAGLEILRTADLRQAMDGLTLPQLRLYGYLDSLVPRQVAQLLDERWPSVKNIVLPKAAHAPFISHPDLFCETLLAFCDSL